MNLLMYDQNKLSNARNCAIKRRFIVDISNPKPTIITIVKNIVYKYSFHLALYVVSHWQTF